MKHQYKGRWPDACAHTAQGQASRTPGQSQRAVRHARLFPTATSAAHGVLSPISEARPSAKSFVLASPLARIAVITCQQVPLPGSPPATLHTGRRAPPKGSVATLRPALRPRLQPPLQSLNRGVTWAWAGIPSSPCPPQVLPSLHPCSPWQALRRPWPLSFLACPLRGVTYPVLTCPANVYLSFTTQPRSEAAFLCSPLGGT